MKSESGQRCFIVRGERLEAYPKYRQVYRRNSSSDISFVELSGLCATVFSMLAAFNSATVGLYCVSAIPARVCP